MIVQSVLSADRFGPGVPPPLQRARRTRGGLMGFFRGRRSWAPEHSSLSFSGAYGMRRVPQLGGVKVWINSDPKKIRSYVSLSAPFPKAASPPGSWAEWKFDLFGKSGSPCLAPELHPTPQSIWGGGVPRRSPLAGNRSLSPTNKPYASTRYKTHTT